MKLARGRRSTREARTKVIHVRATPAQLDAWQRAAEQARRTLSSWVQVALDDAAEDVGK